MNMMALSNRFVFFVFLSFCISFTSIFCEEHQNGTPKTGPLKKRPVDLNKISESELAFLSESFFRAEESVLAKYENKEQKPEVFLPFAITKALSKDNDESMVAGILAELTGSLNMNQIEKLKNSSQALAREIRASEPESRDDRYLAIVERAEWLGYVMEGGTPPIESLPTAKEEQAFAKFKKEFLESYKSVAQKNKTILDKIELAKTDGKAKQWLRDRLDSTSFTRFMKGQLESGGEQLFQDLAESVAWKDDQGQKYHDFVQSEGKAKRIYVGKTASEHSKNLSSFLSKNADSLKGFKLSSKKNRPQKS